MICVSRARVSEGGCSYLSNVDQATHEVPVAEGVDGGLRLFLGGVFDNTTSLYLDVSQVAHAK